jgi:prolipoprotein diacylglyceryl transferase
VRGSELHNQFLIPDYQSLIPSPAINHITLGPFNIYFYALFIMAGILFAAWFGNRRLKTRGIYNDFIWDFLIVVIPCGIIGARIYHVLSNYPLYFGPGTDPMEIFAIWNGGIAIYGSLIGGGIAAFVLCRVKKVSFLLMLDAFAPAIIMAQAIGRIGNYFNQELFGLPTDLPWGLIIDDSIATHTYCQPDVFCAAGQHYHPTFLYEMLWDLLGFIVLILVERKFREKLHLGQLFALYIMFYSFGRVWVEMIRINFSTYIFGLRINVWTAIFSLIAGGLLWIYFNRRKPFETEIIAQQQ